jgi:hypothetical protein
MKKKMICALSAALLLINAACTSDADGCEVDVAVGSADSMQAKTITFTFSDVVSQQAMTRSSLAETEVTDLWVYEFSDGDGTLLMHQSATDDGFGAVRLTLKYGQHELRFVASRGSEPTAGTGIITWVKPSDTFWGEMAVDVSPSAASNLAVTLRRVATRLVIKVTDEIPASAASLSVVPDAWYYGLDVLTGEGCDARRQERVVQIPASYRGTSGRLSASFFGLSPADGWQTDVSVTMKDSGGDVIGSVSLPGVGFSRNVTTTCSGGLTGAGRAVTVSVDGEWGEDDAHEW